MYNSSMILSITTFIYALAAFFYLSAWVFKKDPPATMATWTVIVGLGANTLGIILRWVESYQQNFGHAPFSNLYESLVFFSWTIMALHLFIEIKYKARTIGVFVAPIAFLTLAYASLSTSSKIQPLLPALKSNWLIAHVMTCFIGYAAFAIAFGVSLMYLVKHKKNSDEIKWVSFAKPVIIFLIVSILSRIILHQIWKVSFLIALGACAAFYLLTYIYKHIPTPIKDRLLSHLPDLRILDELTHQMVMFGFLFLSVGIITGAVWANSAWGRYWGWDPKETWSLITWFVYATLLHARLMRGWRNRRIAVMSIIGFLAVLFTYFGVNYLPGLHSYGAM